MGERPRIRVTWRFRPAQRRPGIGLLVAATLLLLLVPRAGTQQLNNSPPTVIAHSPADGSTHVDPTAALSVTFSEPVALAANAVSLVCGAQSPYLLIVTGGPVAYTFQPNLTLPADTSCVATVHAYGVTDLDQPPAYMATDVYWQFETVAPAAADIVINEIDAETNGPEFIELYDGGRGNTSLTGLQVAIYDGATDRVITTISLRDKATDAGGYFLLSADPATADLLLANGALPDGPAAVAVYAAPTGTPAIGSPPTVSGLVDAVVYGSGPPDAGLLSLLKSGEPQVSEDGRGEAVTDSSQRCPNGSGGPRRTTTFRTHSPTPGQANICKDDSAPALLSLAPAAGSVVEPAELVLELNFSEPVSLATGGILFTCTATGTHALTITGGPVAFSAAPTVPPDYGESCAVTVYSHLVSDLDADDPPDHMNQDHTWSFRMANRVATQIVINEIDSDTAGPDAAEFIELYDGGGGNTNLTGLVVVLFNGSTDRSYRAIPLDNVSTDSSGYVVIGNKSVTGYDLLLPDAALQNGPDAVALVKGSASDYPNGTRVSTQNLIDAVVYGPADKPDSGLLPLLHSGQPQTDENGRGQAEQHALLRCPNGSGGQRQTAAFRPNNPTPGKANVCTNDDPPRVVSTVPAANATDLAVLSELTVTFSEPVTLKKDWLTLACTKSGTHTGTTSGGPMTWTVSLAAPVAAGQTCQATVIASKVTDSDSDDPPDGLAANVTWSFSTRSITVADHVLINELDANTPGTDTAEFIELYDGGTGRTSLDGLSLVFFNGNGAVSYAAVSLDGYKTDSDGYFTVGNPDTSPHLAVPNGTIQNGPDAVGLYAAPAASFPSGTPPKTTGLIDAIVYGDDASPDLLRLLNAGQAAVDENSAGSADTHSLQRCPDGGGGHRNSATIGSGNPTPGAANHCLTDDPPGVLSVSPLPGAANVPVDSAISLTFSEPVSLAAGAVQVTCDKSGPRTGAISGGPQSYAIVTAPFHAAERCAVTVLATRVTDLDALDPPDAMIADFIWDFHTAGAVATGILINEFDVDTPGVDTAEFIELFDGGRGDVPLDGLILVLFNGQGDTSYRTVDLGGARTDPNGYAVIGGPDVPDKTLSLPAGALQNGPDAIALYAAVPQAFPNGTSTTLTGLVDAVVYGTADPADSGLLKLLPNGQPQIDESALGDAATHANQRCPNGEGGLRMTNSFRQAEPTPGRANSCQNDLPPSVVATVPRDAETGVSPATTLTVSFSEPVTVDAGWLQLTCSASGAVAVKTTGGPVSFTAVPGRALAAGESCTVRVEAGRVHDADLDDPPDTPAADEVWTFTVAPALCESPTVPIPTIQGAGATSPMIGETALVEGIVTAETRDTLGGLFMQTPDDGPSHRSAASRGLFVRLSPKVDSVSVGDRVLLSGRVTERDQRTTLEAATVIAVCGRNEAVAATKPTPPPASDAEWEALESMLVTLDAAVIVDNAALGSDGLLTMVHGPRPVYPTEVMPPGPAAWAAWSDNQQRLWHLDDGQLLEPPDDIWATPANPLRAGDTIPSVRGVVDGYGGGRRVHALERPSVLPSNGRPLVPALIPGDLRLVSVDLGLLANGEGLGSGFMHPEGAQSSAEYARQRAKVIAMLAAIDADVVAINGLESDGDGPDSTLADLLHEMNVGVSLPYAAITAVVPGTGRAFELQSALLYRSDRVTVSAIEVPPTVAEEAGHLAHPLVVGLTDQLSGQAVEIAIVHLLPRTDCPTAGPDADQQDGQACHSAARTEAAAAFAGWLASRDMAGQTLLLGNWNAYALEAPIQVVAAAGFQNVSPYSDYTQIDTGQTGATLRILAGNAIGGQVAHSAVWHINADEPPIFDFRLTNPAALFAPDPYRAAAIDPLIIDLRLGALQAGFRSDAVTLIGESSRFVSTSTGPGPLTYVWDFGDGSPPATTADVTHTYRRIGTYTVTLTVSNDHETDTVSARLDVLPRRVYLPSAATPSR